MFQQYEKINGGEISGQAMQDFPDYVELINKIQLQLKEDPIKQISIQQNSSSSISSFFKAKNAWMIQYMIQLNLMMLSRISCGEKIPEDQVDRLLESRLIVSKMSSVQKKLQYQVDKIMQVASRLDQQQDKQEKQQEQQQSIEEQETDLMSLKPRPHQLESQYSKIDSKNQKYRAPKLAGVLSKEDQLAEQMIKQDERRKVYLKRKLQRSLENDEQNEEGPPQIVSTGEYQKRYFGQEQDMQPHFINKTILNQYLIRVEKQREAYEEDYFTRLPITKADKIRIKKRERLLKLEEHIDNMGELHDINELLRMEGMTDQGPQLSKTQYSKIPSRKNNQKNGKKISKQSKKQ